MLDPTARGIDNRQRKHTLMSSWACDSEIFLV
jgi:hypothetical protein